MDRVVVKETLNEDDILLLEVSVEFDEAVEQSLEAVHCLDSDGRLLMLNQSLHLLLTFVS